MGGTINGDREVTLLEEDGHQKAPSPLEGGKMLYKEKERHKGKGDLRSANLSQRPVWVFCARQRGVPGRRNV